MKTLIVYYTRTNTTKKLAEAVALKLGADLEEVIDKKDRSGIKGYVVAGKDAMQASLTEIGECQKNPSEYDLVIIGTPVWAWKMTPAIRTYLTNNKEKLSRVAFFTTQGGEGNGKVIPGMEELVGKKSIASLQLLTREVVQDKFADKLDEFVSMTSEFYSLV